MSRHFFGVVLLAALAAPAVAQSGGFVTTLGADTVQIEQFSREGNTVAGVIVTRTPVVRTTRWSMTVDAAGQPRLYKADVTDASGAPVRSSVSGIFTWLGDTLVRDAFARAEPQSSRIAIQPGTFPGPNIPYIGVSNLIYEMALGDARRRAPGPDTSIGMLSMVTAQRAPGRMRVWLVGADSAELDYFGVTTSGYKFDAQGRLLRADWRNTTYRYRISRVSAIDVFTLSAGWIAAEQAGKSFGPLSPRDSSIGMVNDARLTVDYSRPGRRGRAIWGDIVPMDKVWRLGADMATHFTTSADVEIGGTLVPAGRYTLWMIPSATAPKLIVSSAVNVFGTSYNQAKDFARIPLQRKSTASSVERLTVDVKDNELSIAWADAAWTAPVRRKP